MSGDPPCADECEKGGVDALGHARRGLVVLGGRVEGCAKGDAAVCGECARERYTGEREGDRGGHVAGAWLEPHRHVLGGTLFVMEWPNSPSTRHAGVGPEIPVRSGRRRARANG